MATRFETRSEWLAAHPAQRERLTQTLAGVARRVRGGEGFAHAAREFLDEFSLAADDRGRQAAVSECPELTGDPGGALLRRTALRRRLE